jgi:hypothetical protein
VEVAGAQPASGASSARTRAAQPAATARDGRRLAHWCDMRTIVDPARPGQKRCDRLQGLVMDEIGIIPTGS